jgi:hypothetical protein
MGNREVKKREAKRNLLDRLPPEDALQVLRNLSASDPGLRERIEAEVKKTLDKVEPGEIAGEIASEVFFDLELISVEELWDRSGPSRNGYSSPVDMAAEMVEEVLQPHISRVEEYREMGMREACGEYCMGVLQGIYQFEHESESEFKGWAEDVAAGCFESLLEAWRSGCSRKADLEKMDRFIAKHCPKWA